MAAKKKTPKNVPGEAQVTATLLAVDTTTVDFLRNLLPGLAQFVVQADHELTKQRQTAIRKSGRGRGKTTHWNYRVIRAEDADTSEEFFSIHEVYYDKEGNPVSMTVNPVDVGAESLLGVRFVLDGMRKALSLPVLTEEEIGTKPKAV